MQFSLTADQRDTIQEIFSSFLDKPQQIGVSNLHGQCLQVHWKLIDPIQKMIGVEPALTLGYVKDKEKKKDLFYFTKDILQGWVQSGVQDPSKIMIHAWLTLPGLEIVDFVLNPTIHHFDPSHKNRAICESSPKRFEYHPIAICNDFVLQLRLPIGYVI